MTDALIVFCTCVDDIEARRIGRAAVEARLAACATVGSAVESVYHWQGAIESARETMLLLKTTQPAFPALEQLVRALHSYDTPEILAVGVAAGSERYLSWLGASVTTDFSAALSKVPSQSAE